MLEKVAEKSKGVKSLYGYQERDLEAIFDRINNKSDDYNLLYQLPTGGGKTVIFSEIVRRYLKEKEKKVVILTHRIELCKQTSKMLEGFNVKNKVINSKVKELDDQKDYQCFVAMVETLNNRIQDDKLELEDLGVGIIEEAHYN
ncbi:MAG: DEAD/DEAH box helicase family protein, partial [Nonlabens sp.]